MVLQVHYCSYPVFVGIWRDHATKCVFGYIHVAYLTYSVVWERVLSVPISADDYALGLSLLLLGNLIGVFVPI